MALAVNTVATPNQRYDQFSTRTGTAAQAYLKGRALKSPIDTGEFKTYGADLYGKLFSGNSPFFTKGADGSFSFNSGFGGPDDPNLQGHLANMTGATRQLGNQYVQDAATAGPSRGGTGVETSDPKAMAAYSLVKAMGQDYANRYTKAADLTFQQNSLNSQNARSMVDLLSGIFGNDAALQKAAADFSINQGNIGVQLNAQDLAARKSAEDFQAQKYWDETNYARGERQRQREESDWQRKKAAEEQAAANASVAQARTSQKESDLMQKGKEFWSMVNKGPDTWLPSQRYTMDNITPIMSSYYNVNPQMYPKGTQQMPSQSNSYSYNWR